MIVSILVILLSLQYLQFHTRICIKTIDSMISEIQETQFLLLVDPVKALRLSGSPFDDFSYLVAKIKTMYFAGESPTSSIYSLTKNLRELKTWLDKKGRLESLIVGRLLVVAVMVNFFKLFTQFSSLGDFKNIDEIWFDLTMLVGSIGTSFLLSYFFIKLYPKHWLWDQGFTKIGQQWLAAIFNEKIEAQSNLVKKLQLLKSKEQTTGQNLEGEIAQFLESWVVRIEIDLHSKKQKFEDMLPLCEFFTYSFYAGFLLYHPFIENLENSLHMSF